MDPKQVHVPSLKIFSRTAAWIEKLNLSDQCMEGIIDTIGWLVGCGFRSHSAIFKLYSDGTVVQFPNFDLLPGTHAMGS